MSDNVSDRLERRISELEVLVMDHERSAEQLGDVVRDQQSQIQTLTDRISLLENKLSKHAETPEGVTEEFEKPPHY